MRSTDAWVFMFESQTAWLRPYAVAGTVPSPSRGLTVTLTAAGAAWAPVLPVVSTALARAIAAPAASQRRRPWPWVTGKCMVLSLPLLVRAGAIAGWYRRRRTRYRAGCRWRYWSWGRPDGFPRWPRGTAGAGARRIGSAAAGAVEGEAGGGGVVGGPGALEAHGGAGAWADRAVVTGVGGGHGGSALGDGRVPGVGDMLVAGEGELQRPAVDRRGAGIADRDVGHGAALPLAGLGVGDVAAAAPAAGGRDGPGEGG